MENTICPRCGLRITEHDLRTGTGESSIYTNPGYILHEECFFDEEREIDEAGTNNLPETLEKYEYTLYGKRNR